MRRNESVRGMILLKAQDRHSGAALLNELVRFIGKPRRALGGVVARLIAVGAVPALALNLCHLGSHLDVARQLRMVASGVIRRVADRAFVSLSGVSHFRYLLLS